jgi:hypothetical protein
MGVNWRYLKVEKANFQLNNCHGSTVLYTVRLDETSVKKQKDIKHRHKIPVDIFCFQNRTLKLRNIESGICFLITD